MRLSRASGETAKEDARPSTRGVPPSDEHREPGFRDTVRGGLGKLHGARNFTPPVPPAAQHGTFDSSNVDRLDLSEEGIPDVTSERFGRAHSGREVAVVDSLETGVWTFTLTWIPTWRQSTRQGPRMSIRVRQTGLVMTRKGD